MGYKIQPAIEKYLRLNLQEEAKLNQTKIKACRKGQYPTDLAKQIFIALKSIELSLSFKLYVCYSDPYATIDPVIKKIERNPNILSLTYLAHLFATPVKISLVKPSKTL